MTHKQAIFKLRGSDPRSFPSTLQTAKMANLAVHFGYLGLLTKLLNNSAPTDLFNSLFRRVSKDLCFTYHANTHDREYLHDRKNCKTLLNIKKQTHRPAC